MSTEEPSKFKRRSYDEESLVVLPITWKRLAGLVLGGGVLVGGTNGISYFAGSNEFSDALHRMENNQLELIEQIEDLEKDLEEHDDKCW